MTMLNIFVSGRNKIVGQDEWESMKVGTLCSKLRERFSSSADDLFLVPEGKVLLPDDADNLQSVLREGLVPLAQDVKRLLPVKRLSALFQSPDEDYLHLIAAGDAIPTLYTLDRVSGESFRFDNLSRASAITFAIPLEFRDSRDLKVYKPKTPVDVTDGVIPPLDELEEVHFAKAIEVHYPWEASTSLVYFVFEGSRRSTGDTPSEEEAAEAEDIVTMIINDSRRAIDNGRRRLTPSKSAKSHEYAQTQSSDSPLYDGRLGPRGEARTGPPIVVYHPVFSGFLNRLQDTTLQVPDDFVQGTTRLIRRLSVISTKETARENVHDDLGALLRVHLERIRNFDKTSADSVFLHTTPSQIGAAIAINELKSELGSGGSEPSVQASFSYERFWSQEERQSIFQHCCCPSFLISIGGPWIVISGAIFTRHVIVQHLTSYSRLAFSHALDDPRQLELARMFYALSLSLSDLRTYYDNIPAPSVLASLPAGQLHSRFLPFVSSYFDNSTQMSVHFDLLVPLESDPECVTFKARRQDGRLLVVKFVTLYGDGVHRLLATHNAAPALHYYGNVCDDMANNPIKMVVMDYVSGKPLHKVYSDETPLPAAVKGRIGSLLGIIAGEGYVFPDLRRPNLVLVDDETLPIEERIHFIDFDWAGRLGEVRFPLHLCPYIRKTAQVHDHVIVERDHEKRMFDAL